MRRFSSSASARPELVEVRPHWTAPQPGYEALTLEPLSKTATEALLANLAGDAPLSTEVRERIAAAAEGNPLFVEQISAMAAEDSGQLTIPPSIQALLAERLDRLSADERDVIERAAVIGRDFPVAAVAGLLPGEQRTLLTPQLLALVRKGLVSPDPSPSGGDDRFSFQHALVRDAAYNAMPKELRAALSRAAGRLDGRLRPQSRARRAARLPPRAGVPVPARGGHLRRAHEAAPPARQRAPRRRAGHVRSDATTCTPR